MRRAAKRDAVEAEIVRVLRRGGFSVQPLSIADGPDLLLGRNGRDRTAEVKTGNKKLRRGQLGWHMTWCGEKPVILRSVEDAIALVQQR